jgi:putative acetyltransferase
MQIRLDDLRGPEIAELLRQHMEGMLAITPRESVHAFDIERLRQPDVTFWSAWDGRELMGCGAMKELDRTHGELKSMRTAKAHLRKGVAAALVEHMLGEARRRKYRRLSLETGSGPAFEPAARLYERFGFRRCGPFADYREDPFSVFMTREI